MYGDPEMFYPKHVQANETFEALPGPTYAPWFLLKASYCPVSWRRNRSCWTARNAE